VIAFTWPLYCELGFRLEFLSPDRLLYSCLALWVRQLRSKYGCSELRRRPGRLSSQAPKPGEPSVRPQNRLRCLDALILPRFDARGGAVKRSGTKSLQLKICRDLSGTWSLHGLSSLPVANLPSLSASFDYARRECAAAPATIELVIDGFYAVVHQEDGWPRPPLVRDAKGPVVADERPIGSSNSDTASVARSGSSWFSEWRAYAMRLIAILVPAFAAMKHSSRSLLARASQPRSSF
jgi:hypothetical protein